MKTLSRRAEDPSSSGEYRNALSRNIIAVQFPRMTDSRISMDDYKKVLDARKEWKAKKREGEEIMEIEDFERRTIGRQPKAALRSVEPFDHSQENIIREFSASPARLRLTTAPILNDCKKPGMNITPMPSVFKVKPSTWFQMDDVMSLPSVPHRDLKLNKEPFRTACGSRASRGIPIVYPSLARTNKKKTLDFERAKAVAIANESQIKEEKMKNLLEDDRKNKKEKAEETVKKCAWIGQQWAKNILESREQKAHEVKQTEIVLSEDDKEAIESLKRKDEAMLAEKRRKKEALKISALI